MATEAFQQARLERMSAEDFETASIRSTAPSYISEAPSYHSTLPTTEAVPAYTPSAPRDNTSTPTLTPNTSSMLPSSTDIAPGIGLPRIPDPPRRSQLPQLSEFRIPTWSSLNSNPTARHYQAVAHRRVSAAKTNSSVHMQGAMRTMLGRLNEEEDKSYRMRPLEDPYLVGEEAAARARRERLARENSDVLIQDDHGWNWLLAQMNDREGRSASWRQFDNRRRRLFGRS